MICEFLNFQHQEKCLSKNVFFLTYFENTALFVFWFCFFNVLLLLKTQLQERFKQLHI